MKNLPLHELHKRHGAVFRDYNGIVLPSTYKSPRAEYGIVSGGIGLLDLSYRGKLRLSGKEHLKFLQGMLSNDVIKLDTGMGLHATLLTVKGKMLADLYLYKDSEYVLIDIEDQIHSSIFELLLRYRLSYKVKIEDITDEYLMIALMGVGVKDFLGIFLNSKQIKPDKLSFMKYRYDNTDIIIINSRRTKYESLDLYIPIDNREIIEDILAFEFNGVKPELIGNETYETLRVEAGIPKYGIDMNENTIPIEAGLWDALNFEKGCYIGQEVIARIKWRGHVNKHLCLIELDGEAIPSGNGKIYADDKEIGFITSSVFSYEKERVIAMGYIRRGYNNPGTPLKITDENNTLSAVVAGCKG